MFLQCVYFLGCLNLDLLIPSFLHLPRWDGHDLAVTHGTCLRLEGARKNNTFQPYTHNQRPPNFVQNNRIRCHQQTLFTDVQRTCSFPLNILKPFTCEEKHRKCLVAETPSRPNSLNTIMAQAMAQWLNSSGLLPAEPLFEVWERWKGDKKDAEECVLISEINRMINQISCVYVLCVCY